MIVITRFDDYYMPKCAKNYGCPVFSGNIVRCVNDFCKVCLQCVLAEQLLGSAKVSEAGNAALSRRLWPVCKGFCSSGGL